MCARLSLAGAGVRASQMMVSEEPCVDTIAGCSEEVYVAARTSLSGIEITWLIFELGFVLDQQYQTYISGWPPRTQWRLGYLLLSCALLMRMLSLWPSLWLPYVEDWIDSGQLHFMGGTLIDEGRRALKGSTGLASRVTIGGGVPHHPVSLPDTCYRIFQIITSLNALLHSLELLPFLNRIHQPFGVLVICIEQMMADLERFFEIYLIAFLAFSISMVGFGNVRTNAYRTPTRMRLHKMRPTYA